MRKNKSHHVLKLGIAFALLSGNAMANPTGVPVADPAPLSCTTSNFTITAITGAGGEFPVAVPCDPLDSTKGMCADYGYKLTSNTGISASQLLFAVSVDQGLYSTTPSATVTAPGAGDSVDDFLDHAQHEYPVRFNANATVYEGHIFIVGASSARSSTAFVHSGKREESCLIAGPGIPGDHWQPLTTGESAVVAGGKCEITKHYDSKGNLASITVAPDSTCVVGQPAGGELILNGVPLKNNDGHNGITFGNGTTTCYGPPTPKTPLCVCTALPCPY